MTEGERIYHFVIEILANEVGPVADLLADDALSLCRMTSDELDQSRSFLVFLKALKNQMPAEIDRQTLYDRLWHQALAKFEFQ